MLDHPDPELIFLEYIMSNNGAKDIAELKTLKYLSLYERSIRHAEFFQDIILDPSGNIAIASCYVGKVKVLILQGGSFEREFDVSYVRVVAFPTNILTNHKIPDYQN